MQSSIVTSHGIARFCQIVLIQIMIGAAEQRKVPVVIVVQIVTVITSHTHVINPIHAGWCQCL